MAETLLATDQQRQSWSNKFYNEYVRQSGFMPYMGAGETSIFRILADSEAQNVAAINVPLFGRLKGRGVYDAEVLEGNEEDMDSFSDQVTLRWRRNGVVVPKSTSYATEIDLFNVARPALRSWAAETMRDDTIAALGSIIIPGTNITSGALDAGSHDTAVAYASATAAQRNTYLVNNTDRLLFGALNSNASSGNFATSLGNVDAVDDKLTAATLMKAKAKAKLSDPHITPYMTEDGEEWYVVFVDSWGMRDLRTDPAILESNKLAMDRGKNNPIFRDGDLMYAGMIIHEVPELISLRITGAGAGGIAVGQAFLTGQSAIVYGWAQQPMPKRDNLRDYGFRPGVAIEELRGQKKLSRGGIQNGIVTIYHASVADV